jgi:hypothetical protein
MKKKGYYINGYWVPLMTKKEADKIIKEYKSEFQKEVEQPIAEFELIIKIYHLIKSYVNDEMNISEKDLEKYWPVYAEKEQIQQIEKMKDRIAEAKKDKIKFAQEIKWHLFEQSGWKYSMKLFNRDLLNFCHQLERKYVKPPKIKFTIE